MPETTYSDFFFKNEFVFFKEGQIGFLFKKTNSDTDVIFVYFDYQTNALTQNWVDSGLVVWSDEQVTRPKMVISCEFTNNFHYFWHARIVTKNIFRGMDHSKFLRLKSQRK